MRLAILLAVCMVIRAIPRQYQPGARSLDTFFHLFFARKIRKERRLPRYSVPNFPYESYYPWGYHRLLACFPIKWHETLERLTGPVFDTISAIAVAIFATWLFRDQVDGPILATAATAIFIFSPALLRMGSGPRAYSGSPRVMGQTLYLLHIVLAHVAIVTHSGLAAAASLFLGACMVMTAKFANQVLLFFALVLAVMCSPMYLVFALGSICLALLVFRMTAWRILKAQVEHSILYFTFFRHVFMGFAPRSFAEYKKSWLEHGAVKLKKRRLLRFVFWMLDEQFPLHYFVVCVTPALFVPFARLAIPMDDPSLQFLWGLATAAIVWFLLTKTRPMMFLGEGERYLEYAMVSFILLAVVTTRNSPLLWLLFGYTCLLGCICVVRACHMMREIETQAADHRKAMDFLADQPRGSIMVFGNSYYQALYYGKNPVIGFSLEAADAVMPKDIFTALWRHTPLPSYDFAKLQTLFKPKYLFGQAWAFESYRKKVQNRALYDQCTTLIFANESVHIYDVSPLPSRRTTPRDCEKQGVSA